MRMTNIYCREYRRVDVYTVDPSYLHRENLSCVYFQPEASNKKKMMVTLWHDGEIFKRFPCQEIWIKRSRIEWQFDVPIGKFYAFWDQVEEVEVEEYEETAI